MKTLFSNVEILIRNDKGYETLHNAFLGVENDKICYISSRKPNDKYDVIKDYKNHLLIPGLINSHGHAAMTILRGLGSGRTLQDWLFNVIFPTEDKLVPNDVYYGVKLACLEMIASGTTTFTDMYDFPYAGALACAESGLRGHFTRTGLCTDALPFESPRFHECIEVAKFLNGELIPNEEMIRELNTNSVPQFIIDAVNDDRIRGDLCFHAEFTTTDEFIRAMSDANKKLNFSVQIHISETRKENEDCIKKRYKTPLKHFYDCGALDGGKTYCAHCVHATDDDLDIMKKTNTSLITNPSSNMKLASGFAPIRKALDKGVNVGIGTDGCASNNNLDLFEEMHMLAMIQAGYNSDPTILSTTEIFDMATINGAKALHRNNIGKLEVGYKADIVAIDLNKPHLQPNLDTLALLIYSAHGSDVSLTMVDGKILYENGKFFTLECDNIIREVNIIKSRLFEKE